MYKQLEEAGELDLCRRRPQGILSSACYSMLMLKTRRLQVLIDEEQYRRLEAAAARRKVPVAVVVREALDARLALHPSERQAAAEAVLSAPRMKVPDLAELRAELDALRGRAG